MCTRDAEKLAISVLEIYEGCCREAKFKVMRFFVPRFRC
jgi:hypothetical protein